MEDKFKELLDLVYIVTSMLINSSKSLVISWGLSKPKNHYINHIFPFTTTTFKFRIKYLGFHINVNLYLKETINGTWPR